MKHVHHIVPRYLGGTDDPGNLIEVTVTQHAMWHFASWQRTGNWQEELAWKTLAGQISRQDKLRALSSAGGRAFRGPCPARKEAWAKLRSNPEEYEKRCQRMREGCRLKRGPKKERIPKDPEETKRKIAETLKGRTHSEERKRKISEGMKRKWEERRQGKS